MGVEIVKQVAGHPATSRLSGDAEQEHALYRFFAEDESLLYIGISLHPFARMGQHRGDKSWWGEVATVKIARYPNRDAVLKAERDAIKSEEPRYNIVHARKPSRPKPKLWGMYTYWEPAVGAVITIPNVFPMQPGAFWLRCVCGQNLIATRITDHGGDEFQAEGSCSDCRAVAVRYVPRAHPRGVAHLSEQSPYLFLRGR